MLDERVIERLSAYADGELDAQAAGEVERALAQDAELRTCLTQFRKLDGVAATLPVPQMSQAATQAIWGAVKFRTAGTAAAEDLSDTALRRIEDHLPSPPVVSEERWHEAWANVQAQTTDARMRPVEVDLTPGPMQGVETGTSVQVDRHAAPIPIRRSFAALAAAAVVLVVATFSLMRQDTVNIGTPLPRPTDQLVSPEALDQRYFVMVQHVPGIEQPVVCFFLKEPDPGLDDFVSWQ